MKKNKKTETTQATNTGLAPRVTMRAIENFKTGDHQYITFYEMYENGETSPGTTVEAVIKCAINRLQELNERIPSKYNQSALESLEAALESLNERTKDRTKRGVEGTHKK